MIRRQFKRRVRNRHLTPPGPRGHPIFGSLLEVQRDPLSFVTNVRRRYGDVARARLAYKYIYLISHPEDVKYVLQENNHNYVKGSHYDSIRPIVGNGLLLSDGDYWLRHRRIVQPAFHRQRIPAFADTIVEMTEQMLERWQGFADRGQPIDVAREMMRLTLAIITKTAFSAELTGEASGVWRANQTALRWAEHHAVAAIKIPYHWPTPDNLRTRRAIDLMDRVVYGYIRDRRASGEDKGDVLSMLMAARDEETGAPLSDVELRDEIMNVLLAGHETVGNALIWTWYLLSKHPVVERRMRAEIDEVLGDRAPRYADVQNLKYTLMTFEESMRVLPPVWLIERDSVDEDEIGGYYIPPKSTIALSQWVTHRHPDFWENPEGFDPERFTPQASANRHRYAYFPFAGGPRLCLGNNYALMEAPLIMATIARRFRLELVPGHPVEPEATITLRPRYGLLMHIKAVDGKRLIAVGAQTAENGQTSAT